MIMRRLTPGSPTTSGPPLSNAALAEALQTVADLLAEQGANRFRSEAYDHAAEMLRGLKDPVWHILEHEGIAGLQALPTIGESIARDLKRLIRGERWPLLERLQDEDQVEHAFATVPGIGEKLARRLYEELGIESLSDLEAAAWDGRLRRMGGFGEKRIRAVRESLAGRARATMPRTVPDAGAVDLTMEVSIADLLDIDDEYRFRSTHGNLPRVAPHQFNPTAAKWLPVLNTSRGGRRFRAMFCNTEHAHAMGTTHDWVVIYSDADRSEVHGNWTVITSRFGRLYGKRIVRGREPECAAYYRERNHERKRIRKAR